MELITRILELVTALICLATAEAEAERERQRRRKRNRARRRQSASKRNGRWGLHTLRPLKAWRCLDSP